MKHDDYDESSKNMEVSVVSWQVIIMIDGAETYPINDSANIIDCDYDKSVIVHHLAQKHQSNRANSILIWSPAVGQITTCLRIIWLPQTQSLQKKPQTAGSLYASNTYT